MRAENNNLPFETVKKTRSTRIMDPDWESKLTSILSAFPGASDDAKPAKTSDRQSAKEGDLSAEWQKAAGAFTALHQEKHLVSSEARLINVRGSTKS